jgi:uncharacterized protein YbgA (DUF1722 family)/uncharacterized protein YbbK (DUF523 family)
VNTPKPIVVVSQCLGFDPCRYNGESIRDKFVDKLAAYVTYKKVCPEVEIGLGVPRKPVRLVRAGTGVTLVQPDTRRDVTSEMKRFSSAYTSSLGEIDGFLLKGRSPSCGVFDAKVFAKAEKSPALERGPGLFAEAVLGRFPNAAVEDEGRLSNFRIREHFLTKLFLNALFRAAKKMGTAGALVRFQTEQKLLLMAYNQKELRLLGKIVGNQDRLSQAEVWKRYETHLRRALMRPARYTSHINVLMHGMGYFSRQLSAREKAHFLELLEQYRQASVPLSAPVSLVRSWIERFDSDYLATQVFFEPYPKGLIEITDSGKGMTRFNRGRDEPNRPGS